jgi:hypothetical protein
VPPPPHSLRDPYLEWLIAQDPSAFDHDLGSSGVSVGWDWSTWGVDLSLMPADGANWRGDDALRRRLATRLGVDVDRVLLTPGTTGANTLTIASLVRPGDRVAVETPVYSPLENIVRTFGGDVVPLPRTEALSWRFDPDAMARALDDCSACFVSNAHNPTGRLLTAGELRALADACAATGTTLVVDEVYREFPGGDRVPSAVTFGDHVVVTSSVTKAYGLGGLRVGWIAGSARNIDRFAEASHLLFGRGSVPGEWMVERLFENEAAMDAFRARVAKQAADGRERIDRFLAAFSRIRWVPPDVGICGLVSLPDGVSGEEMARRCRDEARVYVVPGEFFRAPNAIRLSFGAAMETIETGLERLEPLWKTIDAR